MTLPRCSICEKFDCGTKCQCACHYGGSDKIRQDHNPHGIGSAIRKTLEKAPLEQALEEMKAGVI